MLSFADLRIIFEEVFNIDGDEMGLEMTIDDIGGWDSISHIDLVLSLEQAIGIKFEPEEIVQMTSVRAIIDHLRKHGTLGD